MKTWHWIVLAAIVVVGLVLLDIYKVNKIFKGNTTTHEESGESFLPEGVTAPPQTMLRDLDAGEKLRYQGHIFTKVVGTSGNAVWEYVSAI